MNARAAWGVRHCTLYIVVARMYLGKGLATMGVFVGADIGPIACVHAPVLGQVGWSTEAPTAQIGGISPIAEVLAMGLCWCSVFRVCQPVVSL